MKFLIHAKKTWDRVFDFTGQNTKPTERVFAIEVEKRHLNQVFFEKLYQAAPHLYNLCQWDLYSTKLSVHHHKKEG